MLAPGSSLGGARPKATVRASDGTLWIAKFPSKQDEQNTGAWEQVAHELARICALNVPESKLTIFSDAGSTYLVKRFDREGMKRIHFSSAMSLLGQTDGASDSSYSDYRANGGSYMIVMQIQNPQDHNFSFASESAQLYKGVVDAVFSCQ